MEKTFKAADLKDFTAAVRGRYHALVRISFKQALKSLRLDALVQNNKFALPYLSPGKNTINVSVADAKELGDNKLVVTYALLYRQPRPLLCGAVPGRQGSAKAHNAKWSDTPTCVQKVFSAKELPATFEIDVPTPKGKYAVYPKMLFRAPRGDRPGREAAAAAGRGRRADRRPDDELKTMPNPFLIGTSAETP